MVLSTSPKFQQGSRSRKRPYLFHLKWKLFPVLTARSLHHCSISTAYGYQQTYWHHPSMFTLQGRSYLIWGKLRYWQGMWFTGLDRSKKTHMYQTSECFHRTLQCHSVSTILWTVALYAADVAFWAPSLTVQCLVKPGKKGCALS